MQYCFRDVPITVTVKGETDNVAVSVHNDGVPIPLGAIAGIFDAMVRSDDGEGAHLQSNSLGLGLYITKEIVSAHGGTIRVTSSEKSVSTFAAHFPRE